MTKPILSLLFFFSTLVLQAQNLANWTQVGPVKFPDNPSVQTTGMGRVSQLVYHPTDSTTLFAVSASGGVYKSSNEGVSWKAISDRLPQTACASLAINPLNPNEMYLGTGDANYNGGGLGMWKTLNGGSSWYQATTGLGNRLVSEIIFFPNDTGSLLAACGDGIYKSTNSGATWTKKTTVNASYRDIEFRYQSTNIIYASSNNYFYVSYDYGETWVQRTISTSIPASGIRIGLTPADTSLIYTLIWKSTASNNSYYALFKSNDNGNTFTLQSDTPNILGYSNNGSSVDGQGSYNLAIAVDAFNPAKIFVAGINVWYSQNAGISWTLKSHWAYGVHADKHNFLFSPFNPNKMFLCHDGGLDRTLNGGNTWTTLEDGLTASEFYRLGNSNFNKDALIGGLQDNGLDVYLNTKFSTIRGGDWTGDFVFDRRDSTLMYYEGGSRKNFYTGAEEGINGAGKYILHATDTNTLFYYTTNIFRSTNVRAIPGSSVSWTQISNNLGGNNTNTFLACAFPYTSRSTFYAFKANSLFFRCDNINATTPVWTQLTWPYTDQIVKFETADIDSNVLYAVTNSNKIFKSKDRGNTWTDLTKNLPANTIIRFIIDQKAVDSSMYVCTAFGVYYRNRFLNNWISFSQGLPTIAQISDMEIMSDGTGKSRLHVSFYGRGIWQTDLYKSTAIAPTADFIMKPVTSQGCPDTYMLVDQSTGSPLSRVWNIVPATGWTYINGTDSLSDRAEIRFTTIGNYVITQKVSNATGAHFKSIPFVNSSLAIPATCTTTTNNIGNFTIGIQRFEFNTIDQTSAYSTYSTASTEDFTCIASTMVMAGTTYTAFVTNGNSYNETAKVYIDYNNNGSFLDANELVGTVANGMGRRSCSVSIPLNPAVTNKYIRMRVVSDWNNASSAPCGALTYGQSEDYAIYIDKVKPVMSITIPKPEVNNSFTALFSVTEWVNGFSSGDITVTNGTLSNFTTLDAFTYRATITPTNNGYVSLQVNAGAFTDIAGNTNNAISDSTRCFVGIRSFTFPGLSVLDSLEQSPTGGSITVYVPYGSVLDSLKALFVLSDLSGAAIAGVPQVSGVTKNNFNSSLVYTIVSQDLSITKTYLVKVIREKNKACDLFSYGLVTPSVSGIITPSGSGGTVSVTVPYGTSLTSLLATFTVSDSARVTVNNTLQTSGVTANNFSNTVSYKVTAQDTSFSKTYLVTVLPGLSKSCSMTAFGFTSPAATGIITPNAGGGDISVQVPYGTALQSLIASFTFSDSAKAYVLGIKQISGSTANNFTGAVIYKVIAQDTAYSKLYTVNVSVLPNKSCELISYSFTSPAATGTITATAFGGIVDISVPFATPLNGLIATFTLSDSAKAYVSGNRQYSGTSANDFSDTVFYIVKAQDVNYFKTYKVVVHTIPNTACDLITFGFNSPAATGIITQSAGGGSVAVSVPASTNRATLVAYFTLSDSARASVNGVPQVSNSTSNNFTTPVTYKITSHDGSRQKNYDVSVTVKSGLGYVAGAVQFVVFPNPANTMVHVNGMHTGVVELLTIHGQLLERKPCTGGDDITFETEKLPEGIYLIRMGTEVARIQVQHR